MLNLAKSERAKEDVPSLEGEKCKIACFEVTVFLPIASGIRNVERTRRQEKESLLALRCGVWL